MTSSWSGKGFAKRTTVGLVGRDDELAVLSPDGPGGALVVLTGERGSGRTTLLRSAAAAAGRAGRLVLYVDLGADRPEWDEYGVGPLLDAITAQFEGLGAGTGLVASTAALRRRWGPDSYRSTAARAALHAEIQRMLTCLGPDPALVLLDDTESVPKPETLAVVARAAGHRAVVATTAPCAGLAAVTDTSVRAAPMEDGEVEELLRRVLRVQPDVWLLETLRQSLGPLSGNPAYVLSMIEEMRRTDRLATVACRACLRDLHRMPMLGSDAPALATVREVGGTAEDVVLLVDGPGRVRVDDVPLVAAALGEPVQTIGSAVDRLVEQMVVVERGGELVVRCPAVGATLRQRSGSGRVRALHAAFVLAATDQARGVLAPLPPEVLADHVTAAGEALEPDPQWESLLRRRAREEERGRPERAARILVAAGRHGGGSRGRARMTERTLRLLLRAGDHEGLARLVENVVTAGHHRPDTAEGVDRDLVAAAAAIAALTLRRPVPAAVCAALSGDRGLPCPLHIAEQWSRGESIEAVELLRSLSALIPAGGIPSHERSAVLLGAASELAVRDIAGALQRLLGPAYTPPPRGPLTLWHRLVDAYRSGRWEEASGWARAMIADHGCDDRFAQLRELATLLASDIAIWQGDDRMVRAWQEHLPDQPDAIQHPLLHAGVRAAQLWASGDGESALAQGWRAWQSVGSGAAEVGRWTLLTRLCAIAAAERHRLWYPRLRAAAAQWCRFARGAEAASAAEVRALTQGVLGDDAASRRARVERAVEPTRNRGHRVELTWVLLAAGATPDATDYWSQAHAIAAEMEAPVLLATLRRVMDEHGVSVPSNRPAVPDLTDVQLRIVELVERGMTNRQIARTIRMSEKTVENHLTRLFVHFGCRTRHGLATARLTARRDDVDLGA